jgi:hypothetical protein
MKIFEPKSMMQEHPKHLKRASTLRGNSWIAPAHILKYLGVVAPLFNEVIHKEVHLYCKGDLEPLSSRP